MTARFGVCLLPTDQTLPPPALAQAVESRGFDLLFFAENSHVPIVHRKNAYHRPEIVEPFARMYDSITALSACAAVTDKLILGTGVCLLTERDPIITAKAIASLDHLAQGRVIFGIAGGWIKEAMEHHGAVFRERWKIVRERAQAIRTLWREDPAEFQGDYVNFAPLHCLPQPYQAGGPPIYIGSNSAKVPARVAAYADGWMPIYDRYEGDLISDLDAACDAAGRERTEIDLVLFGTPSDATVIGDFIHRGCTDFVFLVPPENYAELESHLDELAKLIEQFR